MTVFGREPALWLALLTALLDCGVGAIPGLDQQASVLIIAAVTAAGGLVTAAAVHPFQPAALTGLFGALVALGSYYGLHLSDGRVAAINTLLLAATALILRGQVTPKGSPDAAALGWAGKPGR